MTVQSYTAKAIKHLNRSLSIEESKYLDEVFAGRPVDPIEGFQLILKRRLNGKTEEQYIEDKVKEYKYGPQPMIMKGADLSNIYTVLPEEKEMFNSGVSKESIYKTMRNFKINTEVGKQIKLTSMDNAIYVDLTTCKNLRRLLGICGKRYLKTHKGLAIDFTNIRLPMVIHTQDFEYGKDFDNGDGSIDITLAEDRYATLVVSKQEVGYRVEYFCAAQPNPKTAILMDVFDISEDGTECELKSIVHKYNFPKASQDDIDRFSAFNQATMVSILNIVNTFHLGALDAPSKLKLRHVSPMLHQWHRPYTILPVSYEHVHKLNTKGFTYDPVKIMETFKNGLEVEDDFYDDTIPFIMPFGDTPVEFTPKLFEYLPFEKFTIIDENFLPTDGSRFYITYNQGNIRLGMCGGNDFTFEIAHTKAKYLTKDADGKLLVRKYIPGDDTSIQYTNEHGKEELDRNVKSLLGNLAAFLIHYNNLEPQYHTEPSLENKYELQEHMAREVERVNIISVVKLNHPRRLRYRGHMGGTHASTVEHTRRGHWRTYKSGKRTFVEDTIVNKGKGTPVKKVYTME